MDWPGRTTLQHKTNATRILARIKAPIPCTTPKFHVLKLHILDLNVTVKVVHQFAPGGKVIGLLVQLSIHMSSRGKVVSSGFSTLRNSGTAEWVSDRLGSIEPVANDFGIIIQFKLARGAIQGEPEHAAHVIWDDTWRSWGIFPVTPL